MKLILSKITGLLKSVNGMDISCYEETFINKSLEKRLLMTQMNTLGDYCAYLEKNQDEAFALFDSMNITYSEFFRNPLTFSYLEQFVLPRLVTKKKDEAEKEIRIWSAACAAGQEAYSIALIVDEVFQSAGSNISCHIFATDINAEELKTAERGTYAANHLNKVTLKRINTYFKHQGDTYTVVPMLRERIDFSVFDLFTEKSFYPEASIYGNFDLVFCSNILFYFKPEYRTRILEKLYYSIAPGGYLICGESERNIVNNNKFREIFLYSSIFRKKM